MTDDYVCPECGCPSYPDDPCKCTRARWDQERVEELRRDNTALNEKVSELEAEASMDADHIGKLLKSKDILFEKIDALTEETKQLKIAAVSDGRGGFVDGCINSSEYLRVHEGQRLALEKLDAAEAKLEETQDLLHTFVVYDVDCCLTPNEQKVGWLDVASEILQILGPDDLRLGAIHKRSEIKRVIDAEKESK